jgi:hypothetical protein
VALKTAIGLDADVSSTIHIDHDFVAVAEDEDVAAASPCSPNHIRQCVLDKLDNESAVHSA